MHIERDSGIVLQRVQIFKHPGSHRSNSSAVDVEVRELATETIVTVRHGSQEWVLTFSESRKLTDGQPAPPARPPRWLADVVTEATGFAVR